MKQLNINKRLKVYFHTTSDTKFSHMQYLFDLMEYPLYRASTFKRPYPELQDKAVKSLEAGAAFLQRKLRTPFILEDTELRIEAYSKHFSYPGYDLKRWWQATTFDEIDLRCRTEGTRAAISISHICFCVTDEDLFFYTGRTEGALATEFHHFECNKATPWLNSKDVGAIFIPKGADKPFGSMNLEESLKYDFRYKCVKALIKQVS